MTVTAPLWVGLLIGFAFALPASLWGIGNPETVIRAARLVDRLLVGCFLFVTAIGSVLLYGLHALGVGVHFSPRPFYVFGVTIGGLLFGVGAAVSGYFPGTELIALGEGRRDVLAAIPGGLLGAAAWTALYQTSAGHWLVSAANYGNLVAAGDIATVQPRLMFAVAVMYAVLALSALYFLPRYRAGRRSCFRHLIGPADPHDQSCAAESARYLAEGASGRLRRWPQVTDANFYARLMSAIALFVALLVVLSLILRQPFGLSTTYSWVIGHLAMPNFTYSRQVFATIGWEPFTAAGVLCGALVSAVFISGRFNAFRPVVPPSWRNRFGPNRGKRAVGCFIGSFLVLFGARMAGGCTSGHTLSGGIQLSVSAWVFTAAVMLGMVATAHLLYGRASWLTTVPTVKQSA